MQNVRLMTTYNFKIQGRIEIGHDKFDHVGVRGQPSGSLIFPVTTGWGFLSSTGSQDCEQQGEKDKDSFPLYMKKCMFLEVAYLSLARVWPVKSKGVGVAMGLD